MLPRYCIYTQMFRDQIPGGGDQEQMKRWSLMMGDTFHHMHHYCLGLMSTNRAMLLAPDAQTRRFYLKNAIIEFDYVLQRAPNDFVLVPEILAKKGENLIRAGQGPLGIEQLEHAIQIQPNYWPPYAYMSDFYKGAGDLKRAREILETGLSFAPEAKGLQRRLAELDAEIAKGKSAPRPLSKQEASGHR